MLKNNLPLDSITPNIQDNISKLIILNIIYPPEQVVKPSSIESEVHKILRKPLFQVPSSPCLKARSSGRSYVDIGFFFFFFFFFAYSRISFHFFLLLSLNFIFFYFFCNLLSEVMFAWFYIFEFLLVCMLSCIMYVRCLRIFWF